jgi:hypothetical protein
MCIVLSPCTNDPEQPTDQGEDESKKHGNRAGWRATSWENTYTSKQKKKPPIASASVTTTTCLMLK